LNSTKDQNTFTQYNQNAKEKKRLQAGYICTR